MSYERVLQRVFIYGMILAGVIAIMVMPITVPVPQTGGDFSTFNTDWNGTSTFSNNIRKNYSVEPRINNLNTLPQPGNSALLVIGPQQNYAEQELSTIDQYVRDGGILLLANDFGTGNQITQQILNTEVFTEHKVMDLSFEKKPDFASVKNLRPHPLTANVSNLILNHASTIQQRTGGEVIATTTTNSWLDTNNNNMMDNSEPKGPFTILATKQVEEGEIILLSDPSLLINGMQNKGNNQQFRNNLLNYLNNLKKENKETTTFILDEAHKEKPTLTNTINITREREMTPNKALITTLLMFAVIIGGENKLHIVIIEKSMNLLINILDKLFGEEETTKTEENIINKIMEEHPEWDKKTIQRLTKEIKTGSKLNPNKKQNKQNKEKQKKQNQNNNK